MAILTCPSCGAKNRVDESRASAQTPVCGRCRAELSFDVGDGHLMELTDATFNGALAAARDKPVLVDCWAPWCGPCRMLAPTIEQLARESNGRWIVAKLNTDENPRTAGQFNISSIPTMLIFKNGRPVDQLIGLQPKQSIAQRLAMHG